MCGLSIVAHDHLVIVELFAKVLAAIEQSAADVTPPWSELEVVLSSHFDDEERTILADLLVARPREARVILEEHRYLRGRLAQLGGTLPSIPRDSARTFFDELRAHGSHEERVLAQWTQSNDDASEG